MAVGAKQSDVLESVVIAHTIDMVEVQRKRSTEPLSDAASRARVRHEPFADKPSLEAAKVVTGAVLDEDLRSACIRSLTLSRTACRTYAKTMTWDESARCFLGNLKSSGALLVKREPALVSA